MKSPSAIVLKYSASCLERKGDVSLPMFSLYELIYLKLSLAKSAEVEACALS